MNAAAAIWAVIKALPGAIALFQQIVDMFMQEQDRTLETSTAKAREERKALITAMRSPDLTDTDRSALRRRLYALTKE